MLKRKFLAFLVLGLAALVWPLSISAFQPPGVLKAKAIVKPERILPEGKTQITLVAVDGFQQPIPAASVKISIDTGYFDGSNQTKVFGFTDKLGVFKTVWHANLQTKPGTQQFEATVSKNGYLSKYPLTAAASVVVVDLSNPDAADVEPGGEPNEESKGDSNKERNE